MRSVCAVDGRRFRSFKKIALATAGLYVLARQARGQSIPITGDLVRDDPSNIFYDGSNYYYFTDGNGITSRSSTNLTGWTTVRRCSRLRRFLHGPIQPLHLMADISGHRMWHTLVENIIFIMRFRIGGRLTRRLVRLLAHRFPARHGPIRGKWLNRITRQSPLRIRPHTMLLIQALWWTATLIKFGCRGVLIHRGF